MAGSGYLRENNEATGSAQGAESIHQRRVSPPERLVGTASKSSDDGGP